MQTILDASSRGELVVDPVALVVNRHDAFAAERARRAGIPVHNVVWERASETRAAYDDRVLRAVEATEPDVVLLLGWMHLLAPAFLARFPHVVNIHPAYLPLDPAADASAAPDGEPVPAFRGAHAIRNAIAARSRWYGATVHRVTDAVDRGAVLARTIVPLEESEEGKALASLRPVEAATLATALTRSSERARIDYPTAFEFSDESAVDDAEALVIDVPARIERVRELYAYFAHAMHAPHWFSSFGQTWDAFYELFGERGARKPGKILVRHHDVPLANDPSQARVYLPLLAAARDANVGVERAFRKGLPAVGSDTIVVFPRAAREQVVALTR